MTIHAYLDYECRKCGLHYIPFQSASKCPLCGAKAETVFNDFIDLFLQSASYNLNMYGSLMPLAWALITISDSYYLAGFQLLNSLYTDPLEYALKDDLKPIDDKLLAEIFRQKSLEDALKPSFSKEKCLDKAKEIELKMLKNVKNEREKAVVGHVSIFLMEICEELNKRIERHSE